MIRDQGEIKDSFIAALLVALAFPPFGFWPLAWIGWIFLVSPLIWDPSPRRAALRLGCYSFFVHLLGFYWLAYTFHEFGNLNWLIAVVLALLTLLCFGIIPGIFGALWGRWHARIPRPLRPVVLGILIILFDGFDPRLFPWSPAMNVGQQPLLLASVHTLGTWGWRLLFFGTCVALATFLSTSLSTRLKTLLSTATLFLVFAFASVIGWMDESYLKKHYAERQPVALLQGNVGNYEKKLSKLQVMPTVENVLSLHRNLIEQTAIHYGEKYAQGIETWVAWPETSFPGYPTDGSGYQRIMQNWTEITGGLHLVGAYENALDAFAGKQIPLEFNIVSLFHESGAPLKTYRKNIRLMFGEYIPGDEYFPNLYKLLPAVNHFGRGREPQPLPHPDLGGAVFLPVVCYELLFESYVDAFVRKAKKEYPGRMMVLVNPSNDSWYGPTSEPFQNALLSRWAAVRQGLPLLRPTNTGLSLVVAPWGEVLASGPRDETTVVFGELPVDRTQRRLQ